MSWSMIFLAIFGVLFGVHLVTVAQGLWRYRRRPAAEIAARPMVTLLRPVCGLDRFDAETLETSFKLDYPSYEVIFCAAVEHDPAVEVLRALAARYPRVSCQILIGEDRITGNPKLNNLEKGFRAAHGEWIAMADANLLLPPDYIDRMLEVVEADTGLVTSPPIGIRAGNFWGAVEAAFLNSFQARWQLSADMLGNGFAQGKTLCWRRDVLEKAGGLVALGRDLAEDVASTKAVRRQGLKVRVVRKPFAQPVGSRGFRAVWDRQLRWARVRRDGFLMIFAAEILLGPWLPALALGLAGAWALIPVLCCVWYLAEWALAKRAGWPHGARDVAAMVARDILMPALWVMTWARRGFEWRGSAMDRNGALTPPKAAK
ncbi:ceramide glucosyltransferase [Thioclava sp. GXIMD2076]|uniref:Ceramide glucosyltransferase n=1 Tax=Thioclava kandeliae TaxID=3070818 RepID=A0ABV1SJ66_9RHOB